MLSLLTTLLLLFWSATGVAQSTPNGRYQWVSDDPNLGGMSGIEMSDDGMSLVAVSDRGFLMRGTVVRDENGLITDVNHSPIEPIKRADFTGVDVRGNTLDPEGVAIAQDGSIFVSFEGHHRVSAFEDVDAIEQLLPRHPDFDGMQSNSSLEALAIDDNGDLYTIPERSGRFDRPFPLYRFSDGVWDIPYVLPRAGSFLVVGADFGPDGMLYVLERDFTGFSFLNRVRRVDLENGVSDTVLLAGGQFGNLEGISIWTTPSGEMMITMVADNNYNALLQTEIVEYLMTP
jgi:hypothetical protein